MVLSMKIDTSSEDDDESLISSLEANQVDVPLGGEKLDGISLRKGHSQTAMEVARDIICFNIVLAIMYMFYILYKDSITDAIQRIDNHQWVSVSS